MAVMRLPSLALSEPMASIPMVTVDEQRAPQRENADANVRAGLQGMAAGMAKGQRGLAALASGEGR
jgi:formylmethanofuran dehydrogenase subunit B